ncbi:MAG: diaminopimelate decarboxylase [Vulcanimicrobiota bacterium]
MKSVNQNVKPITFNINEKNHMEIGGIDTVKLVEKYGSPLYVIDEETLRTMCRQYKEAFSIYPHTRFLFASKAFCSMATNRILLQEGFGLEVVSGGEIYTALKSDFPMESMSFNGNNKSVKEIELALNSNLGRIVVDNFAELKLLDSICKKLDKTVNILLRVTPGIECHTHEYIKTGQTDSKFGFDLSQLNQAVTSIIKDCTNLKLTGLHAHIGSQIFETEVFYDEVGILLKKFAGIKEEFGIELLEMNVGGGLGVRYIDSEYPPSVFTIAKFFTNSIQDHCRELNIKEPTLILEPGRSIVSTAGVTLYTIGTWKQVPHGTRYIAVDGGMADNPRPSTGNAAAEEEVTIAGRYCESGDILIKDILLPKVEAGDILCVFNTGAYNFSMSSNYNSVPRPPVILVNKGQADIIVEGETWDDIVSKQKIPRRLTAQMAGTV